MLMTNIEVQKKPRLALRADAPGSVIFFPINAPGMGRLQLLNLWVLRYNGLALRYWVVIAIIVSITLTITLITTKTII